MSFKLNYEQIPQCYSNNLNRKQTKRTLFVSKYDIKTKNNHTPDFII